MNNFFSKLFVFLHYKIHIKIYKPYIEQYVTAFHHWKILQKIKKKDIINVIFLPMNVAMWKYQGLYDLLKKDSHFRLFVFLAPASTFSHESRCDDIKKMRKYFSAQGIPFVDYKLEEGIEAIDIPTIVDPDIIFYAQPYETAVDRIYNYRRFEHSLICHVPYSFRNTNSDFFDDNSRFNNNAWKLYYSTTETKRFAQKHAFNHGRNVVVVGYPSADEYAKPIIHDPWKIKNKKRIIWAPHFTIIEGVGFSKMSNFLNMAEFMRQLAIDYSDEVTFAFKPHPRLYSELVKHPKWGEERTKEYFAFWENSPTTQLETGDFADLFKSSDAMIHDSGSFTVDYLYFGKPVLYDNPNIQAAKATANETAKRAYDVHYQITNLNDIKSFIDEVVLAGNDTMKTLREEYYRKYLLPPNGNSVAQNIYDDLIKSLGIKK